MNHPTVVCCAPDGRVFVAEDPMDISAPADAPLGRILCFTPAGERHVFAEGLHAIFGMQYLEGHLYVLHNPFFSRFEAGGLRGEGRLDLVRSTNPKPWALDWNDHIPANFRLAMDGHFYVSVGDKGMFGATGTDGVRFDFFAGGIVRLRPDGSHLEAFSHGTRNHLDVAINAADELFTYDNTDEIDWWSRVTHMVEGGYYGYPWDHKPLRPHVLPAITDYGAGAATAALSYDEDALPEEYRGNLWLMDWGRREIFRLKLAEAGATYRVAERVDFIAQAPPDFCPVGMAFGPDALTLYITDWRHPDTKASVDAGRLFKATYTGPGQAAPRPVWHAKAAAGSQVDVPAGELIRLLDHPARDVRLVAQRQLARRGTRVTAQLGASVLDEAAPPRARIHALWALDALAGESGEALPVLGSALASKVPQVARQAARALGLRRSRDAAPLLERTLAALDPPLRRLSAAALGRLGRRESVGPLLAALRDDDLFVRQACWTALQGIGQREPEVWPELAAALADPDPRVAQGARFAFLGAFHVPAVQALGACAADPRARGSTVSLALDAIAELHRKLEPWKGEWWAYHPVKLPRPVRTVEWEGTSLALSALRKGLELESPALRAGVIERVAEIREQTLLPVLREMVHREQDPGARAALLIALGLFRDADSAPYLISLLESSSTPPRELGLVLDAVDRIGGRSLGDALERWVGGDRRPADALARAARLLGRLGAPTCIPSLSGLLEHQDLEVKKAAASALGALKGEPAFEALLRAHAREGGEVRQALAVALAQMPNARALEAYLEGLEAAAPGAGTPFQAALRAVKDDVLPRIEELASSGRLSRGLEVELRRVFSDPRGIVAWRVRGPTLREDVVEVPPGAQLPEEGWAQLQASPEGFLDLERLLPPGSRGACWTAAELEVRGDSFTELLGAATGPWTIRVNGEVIHEAPVGRKLNENLDRIKVHLRQGRNLIVTRLEEAGSGAAFVLRAPSFTGGPLFSKPSSEADPAAYLSAALSQRGNAARGRELFRDARRTGCLRCHAVAGEGGHVGPDLSGVGKQFDRRTIAENVLYPSRVVRPGYDQVVLVTTQGVVFTGVLRGETAETVTLVDAAAEEHVVRKEDLAQRESSPVSIMPEGLGIGLGTAEFVDLIEYLTSLRQGGDPPAGK